MKARPILMSAPMVRAVLEGRKTQTRRIVKPQPTLSEHGIFGWHLDRSKTSYAALSIHGTPPEGMKEKCPYGQPGDMLWVRETWAISNCGSRVSLSPEAWSAGWPYDRLQFAADGEIGSWSKRSSIHMPRWANRLTLEITGVRVEQLQAITESDVLREGITTTERDCDGGQWYSLPEWPWQSPFPTTVYKRLWESVNAAGSWDANPWVWVLDFKVHKRNVDQLILCQ